MNESLQTTLKKLRLSGLAQSLEVRLQEASGNGLSHTEFLELVQHRSRPIQTELAVEILVSGATRVADEPRHPGVGIVRRHHERRVVNEVVGAGPDEERMLVIGRQGRSAYPEAR